MTKIEFIDELLDGLDKPPKYFPLNVSMNKNGYDDSKEVLEKNLNPLDPDKFEELISKRNAIVLDVRHQEVLILKYGLVLLGDSCSSIDTACGSSWEKLLLLL